MPTCSTQRRPSGFAITSIVSAASSMAATDGPSAVASMARPRAGSCAKAADALCRYTELGQAELGDALNNPAFVEELTGLINQGYWYFDE